MKKLKYAYECQYIMKDINTKHKYIRHVQIANIIQLTYITHGNCTDDTIVGTTTSKKHVSIETDK